LELRSDGSHHARNCGSEALLSFAERNINSGMSDTIFRNNGAQFRPKEALASSETDAQLAPNPCRIGKLADGPVFGAHFAEEIEEISVHPF
jgi:hypothetical protein